MDKKIIGGKRKMDKPIKMNLIGIILILSGGIFGMLTEFLKIPLSFIPLSIVMIGTFLFLITLRQESALTSRGI